MLWSKNMSWKRKVPVLALAMMCLFMIGAQAVSAAHTTEVKGYGYDPYDPPGEELGTDWYIKKGEDIDVAATLHVDGGNPQWFRWMHFYVYNSKGDQIVNEERNTGFGGVSRCWINSKDWEIGNYKLCIIYWGNEDDDYLRADKEVMIHIV